MDFHTAPAGLRGIAPSHRIVARGAAARRGADRQVAEPLRARRLEVVGAVLEAGDLDRALERTYLHVGKALVMTTTVLVAGFASVLTSDFPRNRNFSAMVCATILSALVCDLILLPAMLKCSGPGRRLAEKWQRLQASG